MEMKGYEEGKNNKITEQKITRLEQAGFVW
jgi:hypothetical protein